MEGRVYLCGWEQAGDSFKLWVRSNPRVQGKGATLNAAQEALWKSVIRVYGDGEPNFEFQPPLPNTVQADDQVRPQFVSLYCTDSYRGYLSDGRANLFDRGTCELCGLPQGIRTAEPLKFETAISGTHGIQVHVGNLAPSTMVSGVSRQAFSDEFLAMLTPEERGGFEWREVQPSRRTKRRFYELLPRSVAPEVGKAGISYWSWECPRCSGRPGFVCAADFWRLPTYVSESLIPTSAVAFAAGSLHEPSLCLPKARWDELVTSRKIKGITTGRVIVLAKEEVSVPVVFPLPVYQQLCEIKDRLWKQYRDELLRSPEVRHMKADPKISDSDVWDYIHANVDEKLALPFIYQHHFEDDSKSGAAG